ncbi:MAG: Rrf2 family protein [Salibacteraceae bacterium]|jgi:Rrf2 family protein
MLSKSCVYAIRSIVFIAKNATIDSKVGIKLIAKELDLPTPYLGKILQKLTGIEIIQGVKGPKGGFYLSDECQEVKLIKIIEVIDGVDYFSNCGMGLQECSEKHPCPLHNDLKQFRDGLCSVYSSKSIRDLVDSINSGNSFIKNV